MRPAIAAGSLRTRFHSPPRYCTGLVTPGSSARTRGSRLSTIARVLVVTAAGRLVGLVGGIVEAALAATRCRALAALARRPGPARREAREAATVGVQLLVAEHELARQRHVEALELLARRAAVLGQRVHRREELGADLGRRPLVAGQLAHLAGLGVEAVARLPRQQHAAREHAGHLGEHRRVALPVEVQREEPQLRAV